ncbi:MULTISPECIES: hypothetical protein [unclassified Sphingobium]|uniref:hypothetical protein n=1 Tax=unclassified Sphingobium TaxID=2611147 RepID=UPI000D3F0985|nr:MULTISPECIES: hypothetical protein [unclassified Sphingobium]MBG6120094.1 hypothetical protein [Sphingobium sp. JAI105]PSO12859.1 hypothetical protein C7E20_03640 [Sphingobium sp. AEW4]TWD05705.1 hypothetical protein FB595_10965 [Sphingobium sp. AEW010]TWD23258.1 hypothetical protein FB596_10965 [Sphingobium sp. AEW013]TWD25118.1 hypothetical protein FB594_10965 [Sphingobium sp. AEW001]
MQRLMDDSGYFLSRTNPIANIDQRDIEATAIRIFARSDVQVAVKRAERMYQLVTDRRLSAEQMAMCGPAARDFSFKSVIMAVNSDPARPRVVRKNCPAGKWLGNDVPPSKWGGDNPDNAYRIIPLAHWMRYELRGQRQPNPSTYVTFQQVGDSNTTVTLGSLEQQDVKIAADGSYVITLDGDPANGRTNHFTLHRDVKYLFIRDSLGDWRQEPDALRIHKLDGPTHPALDDEELARRAIHNIIYDVYQAWYYSQIFTNVDPDEMDEPRGAGPSGGLVSQLGSHGHFKLNDDDAILITAEGGGANYRNVVLHDMWLRSLDFRNYQSHLNNVQTAPDADGRFTYVISIKDPGIQNWLDPAGTHEVLVLYRWQGLPNGSATKPPAISTRRVKLSELAAALPPGVKKVTPEERRALQARRVAEFDRRFAV